MHKACSNSCSIRIYIAGDYSKAKQVARDFCDDVGFCVTVSPTSYVYTGGDEDGVIVGIINYPRFPKYSCELFDIAERLGNKLLVELNQQSFSIEGPEKTQWYSIRPEDIG